MLHPVYDPPAGWEVPKSVRMGVSVISRIPAGVQWCWGLDRIAMVLDMLARVAEFLSLDPLEDSVDGRSQENIARCDVLNNASVHVPLPLDRRDSTYLHA